MGAADAACIGLLTRVDALVQLQRVAASEGCITNVADKVFLPGVLAVMSLQCRHVVELGLALVTLDVRLKADTSH